MRFATYLGWSVLFATVGWQLIISIAVVAFALTRDYDWAGVVFQSGRFLENRFLSLGGG